MALAFILTAGLLLCATYGERQPQATLAMVGVALATALVAIILDRPFSHAVILALSACCVALPLLDRTRIWGVAMGSSLAAIAISFSTLDLLYRILPAVHDAAPLLAGIVAASITSLAASAGLALHPSRFNAAGALRIAPTSSLAVFSGWFALAMAIGWALHAAANGTDIRILSISALVAGLLTLASTRHTPFALPRTGQALVAGIVMAAVAPLTPALAACTGAVAALWVSRSASIGQALRIDDPMQWIGTLLLTSLSGLLLCGVFNGLWLASYVIWVLASIALGLAVAALVWPFTMLLVGLALPPALYRETS